MFKCMSVLCVRVLQKDDNDGGDTRNQNLRIVGNITASTIFMSNKAPIWFPTFELSYIPTQDTSIFTCSR